MPPLHRLHLRNTLLLSLPLLTTSGLAAQSTLLFVTDTSAQTLGPAGAYAAVGEQRPDEISLVTPIPGTTYSAGPMLSVSAQWAFVGDIDNDLDFVESSTEAPGGGIDALLVKRFPAVATNVGPRTVFLSKADTLGFGPGQVEDGDVFRYSAQGALEFFVREPVLQGALNTTDDLDLDAICQDGLGNLYLSFDGNTSVNGTAIEDGAIVFVPASAIVYDASFNVSSITTGGARLLATEADVRTWIQNSGVRNIAGAAPDLSSSALDLSGLEIDLNGGTLLSPQAPPIQIPNLIFGWDHPDADGAIVSTLNGGTVAVVNAVFMGSNAATSGTHLGLRPEPDGLGGIEGLALAPFGRDEPFSLEIYPDHSLAPGDPLWTRQEVTGATPYGVLVFVVDGASNGTFPELQIPGIGGSIYGAGFWIITTAVVADVNGNAATSFLIPPGAVGTGAALVWQAFDLNALRVGLPGAMDL